MMTQDLFTLFLLGMICVPISWAVPSKYAFDAISIWTLMCLLLLSPASALWLLAIAILLPCALTFGGRAKGPVTAIASLALIAGLVASRTLPGWAWIGGAFFTLRALHVVLEWWMGRISTLGYRESLHYFLFLPVLPAGPINRLPHFQHQLRRRRWEPEQFLTGAERVLIGLVWLYLIAGKGVAKIDFEVMLATETMAPFWRIWAGSAVSWVELFFVFAGATHVALGISLMMGLKLEENFSKPWAARNLVEFWTRWHMSLTGWVQDYVFRPITALTRQPVIALIAALLVIGLWHEFSLYYILWALWQSLGIVLSRFMLPQMAGISLSNWISAVAGPICVLGWLSAARPVIGLILGGFP